MRSDWWKFNESMTSGTRPPVRNIRRGEEGVRASDLGPSENQAMGKSEVYNIGRLVVKLKTEKRLWSIARGMPAHCIDSARLLATAGFN